MASNVSSGSVAAAQSQQLSNLGTYDANLQSWIQYPYYWQQAPTFVASAEDYANEVEVDEGDHDAVIRFYRVRGNAKSLVRTITVPKGVLPLIAAPKKGSRR